jgi:prepilin-type N-terminal cleavage/methylation domain-containing protein
LIIALSKIKKPAFTLAEVLITLLIIGVVASLVIPSLIQDTRDAELKVLWKKTYAEFEQMTKFVLNDNTGSFEGVCTSSNNLKNQYIPYINVNKNCATGSTLGNCWHSNNLSSYYLNKNPISTWDENSGLILNTGVLIYFAANSTTCTFDHGIPICGRVFLDTNGFKPPNTWGKDIFGLWIIKNGIKPFGTQGDWYDVDDADYGCISTARGSACAAKYLYN